jgi:hypothetical protein
MSVLNRPLFRRGFASGGFAGIESLLDAQGIRAPGLQEEAGRIVEGTLRAQPESIPDLGELTEQNLPLYQQLLSGGEDAREAARARLWMDVARGGLAFAGGVGPEGQPLQGSVMSQAAQAFSGVPGAVSREATGIQTLDQKARVAALQGAQSQQEAARARNVEMDKARQRIAERIASMTGQRPQVFGSAAEGRYVLDEEGRAQQVLPPAERGVGNRQVFGSAAEGRYTFDDEGRVVQLLPPAEESGSEPFGGGVTGGSLNIMTNVAPKILEGTATDQERREFQTAAHHYTEVGEWDPVMGRYRKFELPPLASEALESLRSGQPASAASAAPAERQPAPRTPETQSKPEEKGKVGFNSTPANLRGDIGPLELPSDIDPDFRSAFEQAGSDIQSGLGPLAFLQNKGNEVFTALGAGQPWPETQEAISELNRISNEVLISLADSTPGKPNVLLYERFSRELVDPARPTVGVDAARSQFNQMLHAVQADKRYQEAILSSAAEGRGEFTQKQVTEARSMLIRREQDLEKLADVMRRLSPPLDADTQRIIMQRSMERARRQREGQ